MEQQKRIKIGVECSSSGNYYLAVMAIEQPELVAEREQAERKKKVKRPRKNLRIFEILYLYESYTKSGYFLQIWTDSTFVL